MLLVGCFHFYIWPPFAKVAKTLPKHNMRPSKLDSLTIISFEGVILLVVYWYFAVDTVVERNESFGSCYSRNHLDFVIEQFH